MPTPFLLAELVTYQDIKEMLTSTRRSFAMVWKASPLLATATCVITVLMGVFPAAIAYVSALLIDAVSNAVRFNYSSQHTYYALSLVILEATLILVSTLMGHVSRHIGAQLSDTLSESVQHAVLSKLVSIEYFHFENPEFNDKMQRATGDPAKPLGTVRMWLGTAQTVTSLLASLAILIGYSPLILTLLVISSVPGFFVNLWSGKYFHELSLKRTRDHRRQSYIRYLLTASDSMKEVRFFGFGKFFLSEYLGKINALAKENRRIAIQQSGIDMAIEFLSMGVLYFAYGSVVMSAARGTVTVGQMILYLAMFRQGQGAISGLLGTFSGLYNDRLQLRPLMTFLDFREEGPAGRAEAGPAPGDGLRFIDVEYRYPGTDAVAIRDLNLHLRPGEAIALVGNNGAGKSTFVKLLTRLYLPTRGTITLDGLDLNAWEESALRRRMTALFQDYATYSVTAGQNIGLGDIDKLDDEAIWREAAQAGLADDVIEDLPEKYHTLLGRRFGGMGLSGGQWQRLSLSRAYARQFADIIVLDEPAAAIDSLAEAKLLTRFRAMIANRIAILISHRFSTVRLATRIIVLHEGRIIEDGSHEELLMHGGHYATMYLAQAKGYSDAPLPQP